MKKHLTIVAALLALASLNTGCISTTRTIYNEPERSQVSFENDTAGRIFYEALSKAPARTGRNESRTEVSIPIVYDHKHEVIEGANVAFNNAVRRCDTNADGKITEQEARIYSESVKLIK
jgi:hypothetical protein